MFILKFLEHFEFYQFFGLDIGIRLKEQVLYFNENTIFPCIKYITKGNK